MRHSFALTRLLRWYREGADVQRLLPQLATYLGHVHITGTQRYLTMTPELLRQASLRFERFAFGSDDHA
jgi:site-specific recombinase XerD